MEVKSKNKSVKRLGSRYGRRVRAKVGKIETEQRRKHKCPYCNKIAVRRVSFGIWECEKCNSKFTGRAYTPKMMDVVEKQTQNKPAEKITAYVKEEEEIEA